MPNTNDFWKYAKEAILSALAAKSDADRKGLLELARTWTQAALLEHGSADKPTAAPGHLSRRLQLLRGFPRL